MRLLNFLACVCIISFIACKDDPAGPDPVKKNGVVNGESSSSAFTLTVNASFNGLNFTERTYGKFGVLFSPANENAEQEFTKWAAGGSISSKDIQFKEASQLLAGDRLHMSLEGLDPETEYVVCAYFESEDGERRMIGQTENITTKAFRPVITNTGAPDPKFFSAVLNATLAGVDSMDTKFCQFGFVCSQDANPTVENGKIFRNVGEAVQNKDFATKATYLKVLTQYHYRPYLLVNGKDYYYGDDKSFSTRDYNENAVDMGTGIMFSQLLLGADNDDEYGDLYRWGEIEPAKSGVPYALYDENEQYIDLGMDDISGTQYDPVRHRLGGAWRMATKQEIDSLITMSSFNPKTYTDPSKNKLICTSRVTGKKIAFLQAPYGSSYGLGAKSIRMIQSYGGFYLWSSTSYEQTSSGTYAYLGEGYTAEYVNEILDQMLDQYVATLTPVDGVIAIDTYEFYSWVLQFYPGILRLEQTTRKYRYAYEYAPNYSLDDADYYLQNPGEMREAWGLRPTGGSTCTYAQLVLPVRDKQPGDPGYQAK